MNTKNATCIVFWVSVMSVLDQAALAFQPPHSVDTNPTRAKRPLMNFNVPTKLPVSFGAEMQESQAAESLDWSFVDGVYLITCPNADNDGERIGKAKDILGNSGLLDRLQVKEFQTDDENRIRGCYTSHISVMQDILDEKASENSATNGPFGDLLAALGQQISVNDDEDDFTALIIEDNLALSDGDVRQSQIAALEEFSQSGEDWDMIHLSYIPYVPDLKVSRTNRKDIVKLSCGVGSALGTTAYLINTKAMRAVLDHDSKKGGFYAPIPDVMAELFPETRYALHPTVYVRAPKTSSLVNPQLDDLRSLLFQPVVAAFAQNLLVQTGLSTNTLLPLIILLLLGASGASAVVTFDSVWSLVTTGSLGVPIFLPLVSSVFSLFSLAVIAQGVILAPKPTES